MHDKTPEDARREAAVQMAPGGPIDVAQTFLYLLNTEGPEAAGRFLAPDAAVSVSDLSTVDLRYLHEPGWGWSGRPRVVGPDTELVLLIKTGTDEVIIIDQPTILPSYPFILRKTEDGWRIMNLGVFPEK